MKKIGIFLLVILLTLSLTGCSEPEDVNNALDDYCENNPESTLCTNPEAKWMNPPLKVQRGEGN